VGSGMTAREVQGTSDGTDEFAGQASPRSYEIRFQSAQVHPTGGRAGWAPHRAPSAARSAADLRLYPVRPCTAYVHGVSVPADRPSGPIDPYRFLPFMSRRVMQAWAGREQPPTDVAWTPLRTPLWTCRVALLTSAGIAPRDTAPFDQQGERDNPWWGDPSWRRLPSDVTEADVRVCHLHIDHRPIEDDLDVALPLRRLAELVDDGVVGAVSDSHYSIMGYVLDARELVEVTAPEIAADLVAHEVDLVVLVPV